MLQIWSSRIWLIFDYSLAYLGVLYKVVSLSITRDISPCLKQVKKLAIMIALTNVSNLLVNLPTIKKNNWP